MIRTVGKTKQFRKNSIMVRIAAITLALVFVLGGTSASAAALSKEDFIMVFNADGITVGDPKNGEIPVKFDSGSFGTRLTYMTPVQLDGLKIVLKNVSIRKGSETDGVGLWMTFSQEAGHYWGDGATGTHIRISSLENSLNFYAKKADDADDAGDDIFYGPANMALKAFPISTTITVNKVGVDYEFKMNNEVIKLNAAKVDATISKTGQCYWNFGVTDDKAQANSFVISEISNTKQPATTPATTTTTTADPTQNGENTTTGDTLPSEDMTTSINTTKDTPQNTSKSSTPKDKGKGANKTAGIIIAVVAVVLAGAVTAFVLIKRKNNAETPDDSSDESDN